MELFLLIIPILEVIGYAILWPIVTKGARPRIPRQFSLADFAALLCYVQLVLTLTYYYRGLFERSMGLGVVMGFMALATVALWGATVSTLNQLEIHSVLRRSLFMLVLLPGVIFVMLGLPWILLVAAQNDLFDSLAPGRTWLLGGAGSVAVLLL